MQIDHTKITDSSGDFVNIIEYIDFTTNCGICGVEFLLTSAAQKYILEVRRVPVKLLRKGAAFCDECTSRRSKINSLKRAEKWRTLPHGKEELHRLLQEELALELRESHHKPDREYPWPYG